MNERNESHVCVKARNPEFIEEVCECIVRVVRNVEKSTEKGVDSRDFLVVPYCLGRLKADHPAVLYLASERIRNLVASRINCMPLDALQALEGFWLLGT
jgi:hypothetical protein